MAATYGGSGLKVKLITSVESAGYEGPVFCARVLRYSRFCIIEPDAYRALRHGEFNAVMKRTCA